MTDDDLERRTEVLNSAEALVASAVALLQPIAGHHTTIAILQQMVEEQATFASIRKTDAQHPDLFAVDAA